MKVKKRRFIFVFFLLLFLSNSKAQKAIQFSNDTVKFTKELAQYFIDNSANKETAQETIKKFEKLWKDNEISGYFKEIVILSSNSMLAKRMKPFPYFYNYINTVISCVENKQPFVNFQNWQNCLDKLFAGKSIRSIQELLEIGETIFKNNVFYKTPSYSFYSKESNFIFKYDSIPSILFDDITLIASNPRGDSMAIEETNGVYYPSYGKFVGKGGKVSWEKTGLDNSIYAKLKNYTIDCKTGNYESDSATFTGQNFFEAPEIGRISDRIITENGEKTYPRFDSYSKRLTVKNIYPSVDYEGGFGMRGSKFIGSGSPSNPAKIVFNLNGVKFLEVAARAVGMSKEKIGASSATVKFFLDKDTIYHPNLSFIYSVEKKQVTLIRGENGLEKTPFINSYHKFDMYFEQIIWKIDEPTLSFNFLLNNLHGEAFFESFNFYNSKKTEALKMGEQISLVTKMIDFYNVNNKKNIFSVVDFAKHIKYLASDLRPLIFKMAVFGAIYYNPETDLITIRTRLFDYAANAKHKLDYDVISIHSIFPGADNAIMNLLNYDITVRGVNSVLLSDSQKVFMFPKNKEIILKKNRQIQYSGNLSSGKFEFVGKNFLFDYELFKVKMPVIDTIRIFVEAFEPDINGNILFKKVQTLIENVDGELKIDAPKNKSGYGRATSYPNFQSFKESYAYYDKRQNNKGAYKRDKFYFKLDPFSIDSLDNFTNQALKFEGTFSSAGIFPNFKDTLSLQKDYSLGFIRQTPPGGFKLYGGKGNFEKEIRLSNQGLRGGGNLNFSASSLIIPDMVFFADSANGVASTFDIKEGDVPEFPKTHGENVKVHFMPYQDLMQVYDVKKPFDMYKENFVFKGRLDLTLKELIGDGKFEFEKADLFSDKILFAKRKFSSDTANFKIKSFVEEGFTFSTVNVKANIDFDNRFGEFSTNGEASFVKFDKNQYIAYMDRFKWFMDAEDIELGDTQQKIDTETSENGIDLEGPEFISLHPKQDSLRFFAPGAKYNLRKYIISCKNVPFINVADARMIPYNGDVTIFKNAVLDTLKNAKIIANTVTKYHTINNSTINIFSRRNYLAFGDYEYIDENGNPFLIKFKIIKPDTSGQTISEGLIPEKDNFKFNDYFSFAGKVYLQATQQFLTFDGGTKIVHDCIKIGKSYLKFTGEIDPKEILIPIPKNAKDMNGVSVGTGIFYNADDKRVFPSFLSLQEKKSSQDIILAEGLMSYDKENQQYEISNKEKLSEKSLPGNYLSLNTSNCIINSEGSYNLRKDTGQVYFKSIGNASFNPANDSLNFNLMLIIDFFFNNSAIKKMAKDFELYLGNLDPVPFEGDLFNHGIIEILGKDKGDRALSELNLYGIYKKFPEQLEKNLVFNDVKMTYDKGSDSYISIGKIGLGNILKTEIFRYMNGTIQIKKLSPDVEILNIYLEADANTWYFFTYTKGKMLAVSSNKEFNQIINEMKGKNKKMNVEKGPSYRFDVLDLKKKDKFITDINNIFNKELEPEENKDK